MIYDCVVVGAGAAGVTASHALAEAGVEHAVLERGVVGNTWATQRWDAFRLNTPGSMNVLLGAVADDPAIRFVGMPWQSTRASAILHGMPLDARRAVDGVTGMLVSA
ncbi:MAG: FAD-binding protein [Actinomycetales bacterium]